MARHISWGSAASDGYEVGDIRPGYADSDDGRWMLANGRQLPGLEYPDLGKKWFSQITAVIGQTGGMGASVASNPAKNVLMRTSGGSVERSLDGGVTWDAPILIPTGSGANPSLPISKLQFVNGVFFAFRSSTSASPFSYSLDDTGLTWEVAPFAGGRFFREVAFGAGRYVFSNVYVEGAPTLDLYQTADLAVAAVPIPAAYVAVNAGDAKRVVYVRNHGRFYAHLPGSSLANAMRTSVDGLTWTDAPNLTNASTKAIDELGRELAVFDSATSTMLTYYASTSLPPTKVTVAGQGLGPMNDRGDVLVKFQNGNQYYVYTADGSATFLINVGPNISFGSISGWAQIPGGGVYFTLAGSPTSYRAVRDPTVALLPVVGNSTIVTVGSGLLTSGVNTLADTARGLVMKVRK